MNEFERKMLSMMEGLTSEMAEVKSKISIIDKRLTNIENDIIDIKENADVTRGALNCNGETLEMLVDELKNHNIIA